MSEPLRALIVTPDYLPAVMGNAVTVHRIATALAERGVALQVRTPAELDVTEPRPDPAPDVIHAFHARKGGTPARVLAGRWGVALLITVTGTDANVDLSEPSAAPEVLDNLRAARVIVVFHASMGEVVARADPSLAARIRIIPQTPWLPATPYDFRAQYRIPRRAVVLFLPGGIRPVKNTLMPFAPFRRLRARHPNLHLVLAGPRLDAAYAATVDAEIAATPGAIHIGEVPHERMYGALMASDLVLNVSHSEGGMANTLLEAMTTDTPVLARRIAGNTSLVTEGVTGLTFETAQEFEAQVERFLADPRDVKRLAAAARESVAKTLRREAEAQSYELVYREAAAST